MARPKLPSRPRSSCSSATGRRAPPARCCPAGRRDCTWPTGPRAGRRRRRAHRRAEDGADRGVRVAARAHAGDRRADRQGHSACGCGPSGACSSATSASGRAASSRTSTRSPSGRPCSATRAGSGSRTASRSPRCRRASTTPRRGWPQRHPGETVVAVSHADPIKAAVGDGGRHAPRPVPAHRRIAVLGDGDRLRRHSDRRSWR